MKKQFVLIGVGRFGASLAKRLSDLGQEVLAIDLNEEKVADISRYVTHAVQLDATDEESLLDFGIRNFDVGVVAIDDIQSSVLVTLLLIEQGIPYVVVKAANELHAKLLYKLGVNEVVFPERDMGVRMASNLVSASVLDMIELSEDYSIVEIKVADQWVGRTLAELNFRNKYGVTVIAINSTDKKTNVNPMPNEIIKEGDIIVAIGETAKLNRIEKELTKKGKTGV